MQWYRLENTEPKQLQSVRVKRSINKTTIEGLTEETVQTFDGKYLIYDDKMRFWLFCAQRTDIFKGFLNAFRVNPNDV